MAYSIEWYVPNRVFIYKMWGSISLEDIKAGSEQAHTFTSLGTAPVHCIVDSRYVKSYPVNFGMIKDAAAIIREPNFGYFIHVHQDKTAALVTKILVTIANLDYESTMNVNDALRKLRNIAPDLQDLPAYPDFDAHISRTQG